MMAVTLVSGSFFHVLRVGPAMGRVFGPGDDSRSGGNPVIVLSDKGWNRRFDRDPLVVGRTVLVNGAPFDVIGVMPTGFRGLTVGSPDFWAPLSQLAQFLPGQRGREENVGVEIIGRLKPGLSKESARAQLTAWDSNQAGGDAGRQAVPLELEPRQGTIPHPMEAVAVFAPLFFAFGLILLIGCANVANLLLARGVARQREIGIRLSVGASRRRIVRQLLTESVLLALAAAVLGYVISRIALEQAVYWALRSLPADLGDINLNVPAADWRVALFLLIGALAATAFFALLPALHATRIDPVRTLRGELLTDARPGRARHVLIGIQVFASALLLICAAVFLRSAIASARFDPGLRTADTIVINGVSEPKREAVLQAIGTDSTIAAHAALRPGVLGGGRPAFADPGTGRTPVSYKFASADYFDVLGVPIIRGRPFSAAEREGNPVAIVSESVARALWPGGTGLGATLRLEPDRQSPSWPKDEAAPPQLVTVVGVSRDVAGFRFSDVKDAGVFLPTTSDIHGNSIVARVNGDPDPARVAILDRLTRIDPAMGQIATLRSVARLETIFLRFAFVVALVLGGLALILTLSGLFSVLSYLVEQRTREIGVRMALGASSGGVTTLMLRQTARPVLAGLIAGAGLAAVLARVLLTTPFGAFIGEIVHVADPVAYVASLFVIVTASLMAAWIPAARAARIDPSQTLRRE
jgi:predicted permease